MKTKAAVLYEMGLASPYETSHPLHIEELERAAAEAVRKLIRF